MNRLSKPAKIKRGEPTIALINIVFLLLMFFLIAGQLNQPVAKEIRLINLEALERALPEAVVSLDRDGRLERAGEALAMEALMPIEGEENARIRIAPDQGLDAARFVETVHQMRAQGWQDVILFGEAQP